MPFSLDEMKTDVVNALKERLCPECTIGTEDFFLNRGTINELVQSFIPFSTAWRQDSYRSFPVDIRLRKTGAPAGSMYLYLMSDSNGVPANTITGRTLPPSTFDDTWVDRRFWLDLSDIGREPYIGSSTSYWIKLVSGGTGDVDNYYRVQRNTVNTQYWAGEAMYRESGSVSWNTLNADIRFKVSLPTWIYSDYPNDELSIFSYPRIAVDIVGRPRIRQPWIDHKLADYHMNVSVVFYSRYPREMDNMISYADRALFQKRVEMDTFRITTPGQISTAVIPREGLFVRSMLYTGVWRETTANE